MRRRAFGKRLRDLFRARETAHVLLVDRVDAAAADAVVRLILNQRPPCISQLAARVRVSREPRERRERLGIALQFGLNPRVRLLEVCARRQHARQQVRVVLAAAQLACDRFQRRRIFARHAPAHAVHVCGERRMPRPYAVVLRQAIDELRNRRVRLDVIDAVHQQHLPRDGSFAFVVDGPHRARNHFVAVERNPGRIAVPLGRKMHQQHARAVRRFPPVLRPPSAEPAPQNRVVEPQLSKDLRHLRDVAEQIRQVSDGHRAAVRLRDAVSDRQISHERFTADEELVGHDVPRADEQPARRDGTPHAAGLLRPHLEVILEHDRLAVEVVVRERRIAFEQIEHAIDQIDEPEAELLAREIPLAIPVRVRHDVDVDRHPQPLTAPAVRPATKKR